MSDLSSLPPSVAEALRAFGTTGPVPASMRAAYAADRAADDARTERHAIKTTYTYPIRGFVLRRLRKAGFSIEPYDVTVHAQIDHTPSRGYPSVPRVRIDLKGHGDARVVKSWTPTDGELGAFVERVAGAMKVLQGREVAGG